MEQILTCPKCNRTVHLNPAPTQPVACKVCLRKSLDAKPDGVSTELVVFALVPVESKMSLAS